MTLLEKHFDTAFAAPDGIRKLRELILTLAMQGKLVPQDPADRPACELLQEIAAEKKRLVKEGKIKAGKSLQLIKSVEVPYQLPVGWESVKFGDVYSLEYGDNLPSEKRSNSGEFPVYGSNGIVGTHNISFVNSSCIVVGRKGSAGALNLSLTKGCCVTDVAYYCIPPKGLDLNFSFKLFQTLSLDALGKGIKPGLNRNEAYELPVAIPPLAEQHRIVAKIDQLMARCDELEKLRAEREQKRLTVHTAALNRLFTATEINDFNTAWRFITQNFGELYSVKENVAELRKAILQLAVMGKLVPQDPNDQPASELLKKIDAEKNRLIKEGKVRLPKPLPTINQEEVPYPLPEGWEWTRLGNISTFENGDRSSRYPNEDDHQPSGIPFFGAKDMVEGMLRFDNGLRFISEAKFSELSNGKLIDKDFVILLRGTVGKMAVFRTTTEFTTGFINAQMLIVRMLNKEVCDFFSAYSASRFFQALIANKITGSAVKQMPANVLLDFLTPLPPLAEQRRIVTKIDKLMAMCDEMEKQIDASTGKQTALLNAVMAQP